MVVRWCGGDAEARPDNGRGGASPLRELCAEINNCCDSQRHASEPNSICSVAHCGGRHTAELGWPVTRQKLVRSRAQRPRHSSWPNRRTSTITIIRSAVCGRATGRHLVAGQLNCAEKLSHKSIGGGVQFVDCTSERMRRAWWCHIRTNHVDCVDAMSYPTNPIRH